MTGQAGKPCGGNAMIQVDALTKHYGSFCAVDHISFTIAKGEILGLLGPNGAGKTTTLRMLTGFLKPSAGTIRVGEMDIDTGALDIKRMMGYLPESAPLYHDMLVFDYLGYVAEIRGLAQTERAGRIRRMAELCQIGDVMHRPIGVLSKGYKQRVGLAHAMMSDPEILVLDEPTSGLDPNQIVEIRDIIREIGREKTVVLSTHILPEAEATCDRILIIHNGHIAADGSTEEIKRSAAGEYLVTLGLHDAAPEAVQAQLESVAGVAAVQISQEAGGLVRAVLTCRSDGDPRPAVYQAVKATDWTLVELNQETQTLETIFRKLTQEN
jgi:ABC-2 type transport system ATP-binding protein